MNALGELARSRALSDEDNLDDETEDGDDVSQEDDEVPDGGIEVSDDE